MTFEKFFKVHKCTEKEATALYTYWVASKIVGLEQSIGLMFLRSPFGVSR